MYYRIFSKIYERAARKMCSDCKNFIPKGSRILDLGSGSGIVAKNLANFFESLLTAVDIKDSRVVNVPLKIIDGKIFLSGTMSLTSVLSVMFCTT